MISLKPLRKPHYKPVRRQQQYENGLTPGTETVLGSPGPVLVLTGLGSTGRPAPAHRQYSTRMLACGPAMRCIPLHRDG
jgi:hypothetical protein